MTFRYPAAPRADVVDDYHGTLVADPFRTLENAVDPATIAWVDAENALTRSFLDRPEREALRQRLTELFDYPRIGLPVKRGGRYFFASNSGLQNQAVWYVRESRSGEPRVLLDPNTLAADGTVAVTAAVPTRDGTRFAYALSRGGSDRQEIFVRDVASGSDLAERVQWVKFSSIAWTGDGRAFYYTRYPAPGTVPPEEESLFPKVCLHVLGTPQDEDVVVFEKPGERETWVGAQTSHDGRWLLLLAVEGASDKSEVHVIDLYESPQRLIPVFTGYDNAFAVADVYEGKLYATTDYRAPRRRVIAVDLAAPFAPDAEGLSPFAEIVPEGTDKISWAALAGGRLLVDSLRNASDIVEVFGLDGGRQGEIALPGLGSVSAISAEVDDDEAFLTFQSYTMPPTSWRWDAATGALELFETTTLRFDPSRYDTGQVWYVSKDGTHVSMFLVHERGMRPDGNRPVYLYGYGGFNVDETPVFAASFHALLERGAVLAFPQLRGGGEYGEGWHSGGMRESKQNTFDDFIAAAEWLVRERWTRPARLAIAGGSNGGLLVAACMSQRPELFGVVHCAVPVADMLRFQHFTVGRYWVPEYGNAEVAADFPFLYAYSPLHNVRDGVAYPAMLITTADTDDRVDPMHAKKLAARLQEATSGSAPILVRIETRAGHGAGKPIGKLIDEKADVLTFLFWQLGLV